jgi:hypothetical protein
VTGHRSAPKAADTIDFQTVVGVDLAVDLDVLISRVVRVDREDAAGPLLAEVAVASADEDRIARHRDPKATAATLGNSHWRASEPDVMPTHGMMRALVRLR